MRNGKNIWVWLALIIMIVAAALWAVFIEGARRKAQEDRPGGPVPMLQEETPEKKASQ